MTEWPAAVDRRYHDAVIFDLDGLVTETVSASVRAFDSTVPVLRRLRVYRGQRLHLRISGRTAALTAEAGGLGVVDVECRGRVQRLLPGQTIEVG
ncbi:hypothetical protein [Mycobacterium sp.]|uniref:hypothetical protein n=1 Tax=Mycobacterium sp. TaxID=1785 RepID=UPI003F9C055E